MCRKLRGCSLPVVRRCCQATRCKHQFCKYQERKLSHVRPLQRRLRAFSTSARSCWPEWRRWSPGSRSDCRGRQVRDRGQQGIARCKHRKQQWCSRLTCRWHASASSRRPRTPRSATRAPARAPCEQSVISAISDASLLRKRHSAPQRVVRLQSAALGGRNARGDGASARSRLARTACMRTGGAGRRLRLRARALRLQLRGEDAQQAAASGSVATTAGALFLVRCASCGLLGRVRVWKPPACGPGATPEGTHRRDLGGALRARRVALGGRLAGARGSSGARQQRVPRL
jgi:hypothetical protein